MSKGGKTHYKKGELSFITMMIVPSVIVVLIFTYYPLLKSIPMAFQNYNLFNINNIRWIGLENFAKLFENSPSNMFYNTLSNTAKWLILSLLGQFSLGFVMSLVLQESFLGKKIYQALIFFPWAISGFTIGIMWRWMFNGTSGVINDLLIRFGFLETQFGFLSETSTAIYAVIIANIWYGIPFFTIMITAALQGVPLELYEAAEVDGCGAVKKFFSITLPHIKPVLLLTVLLRVIWIFNFPDLIFSMTAGAPAGSSHIVTSLMMEKVRGLDYGMGSAIGLLVIVFLSMYTILYLGISNRINQDD